MNGNVLKGGIFMNPTKEFRDYMISQGAALVGIVDLTTQCMKHQQSTPYTSAHPPATWETWWECPLHRAICLWDTLMWVTH